MIGEVREAFKANLPNLEWMDDETRALARQKADAITDMIGFPEFILDPVKLDEKYQPVSGALTLHVHSLLNASVVRGTKSILLLPLYVRPAFCA